jgi:hypothetical protein
MVVVSSPAVGHSVGSVWRGRRGRVVDAAQDRPPLRRSCGKILHSIEQIEVGLDEHPVRLPLDWMLLPACSRLYSSIVSLHALPPLGQQVFDAARPDAGGARLAATPRPRAVLCDERVSHGLALHGASYQ